MAKDPFNNLPPIQEEPAPERPQRQTVQAPTFSDESAVKGNAPRNLLNSISKFAVPVAALGIGVWLFMPSEPVGYKKADVPEPVLDQTKQVSQTNAMLDSLREHAAKVPPPKQVDPQPGVPAPIGKPTALHPTAPLPVGESDSELAKLRIEKERREQDIRSSPLEAGSFKLVGEEGVAGSLLPRPKALDIQAEIAANNAARQDAAKAQEKLLEKAMASTSAGREAQKNRSPNLEFRDEQAAASKQNDVVKQNASASRYLINQGSVIRTVMLTGVNSDLPGTVKAQVTSDVYDSTYGQHVLIPKGSVMIGAYNSDVVVGQERLMMAMTRLILPDGSWVSLAGASASDGIGQSGIEANVNNHFWKIFGTSLILGAASTFLPDRQNTVTSTNNAGGNTQGGTVLGMALNDTLRTLLERNKNIPPTLTLRPGQEFSLLVAKDIVMRPYR